MSRGAVSEKPRGGVPADLERRGRAAAVAVGALLGLGIFLPLFLHPRSVIAGGPRSEILDGLWTFVWVQDTLLEEHTLRLRIPGIGSEEGAILYPLGMINALVSVPLRPLLGAIAAFNAATVGCFLLAFGASWALFRRLGGSAWAALPGACVVALSPAWVDGFSHGVVEEWTLGWTVLALWVVIGPRKSRKDRLRGPLLAGAALAVATFANAYYGLFAACAAAWLVVTRPGAPWGRRLAELAAMAGFTAALVLPLAGIVRYTREHPDGMALDRSPAFLASLVDRWVTVDLVEVVLPLSRTTPEAEHGIAYLGIVGFVAGVGAMVRCRPARRWAWLGFGALVFGLGGTLVVAGHAVKILGHPVPLPAHYLCRYVPPFTSIAHPFRALVLVSVALGAALSLALGQVPSVRRRAAIALALSAGVIIDLVWVSPARVPVETRTVRQPAFYRELAQDREQYGIVDIPVAMFSVDRSRYLFYQRLHRKWVPYTLDAHLPTLADAREARRFLEVMTVKGHQRHITPKLRPRRFDGRCEGSRELQERGYRYLVLHRYLLDEAGEAAFRGILSRCLPHVVHEDEDLVVFGYESP